MRILILALVGINTFVFASLPPKERLNERLKSEMDFLRQEAFSEGIKKELKSDASFSSTSLALEEQYFSDTVSTGLAAPEKPENKKDKFKDRDR